MFKFENPLFLYFLGIVPLFLLFLYLFLRWRKQAVERFGTTNMVARLMPNYSEKQFWRKTVVLSLALVLLCIAWANPQKGGKREKTTQKSADIFIALDISKSMLSEDIAPNRLERASVFAQKIVKALPGQRVGLIFFAGSAYVQMPLTTDYGTAVSFLNTADPEMISEQGTAISEALDLASESFDPTEKSGRAVILITDGENHDDEAIKSAEKAFENGIIVLGVGVGTPEGGSIPIGAGVNADAVKRDENGEVIKTKLNEKLIFDIAKAGGGSSYNLSQEESVIESIAKSIDQLKKRSVEIRSYSTFESYYQWFLLPGLLLLLLEFLMPSVGRKQG
jgi:Ca-activated chloride channel homolog